jgi:hypothetical protein
MPPQVCLGRSPGRVHNNRQPSNANRSSRLCLPADESSGVNFVGARFGSGVRVGFQSLLLVKAMAFRGTSNPGPAHPSSMSALPCYQHFRTTWVNCLIEVDITGLPMHRAAR